MAMVAMFFDSKAERIRSFHPLPEGRDFARKNAQPGSELEPGVEYQDRL